MIEIYIPYIALLISLIALYFGIRRFFLKSGIKIHGSYSICSSVNCDDEYVHRVKLENLKDRATTIYGVYLKIGYGYYIEIEDFEDNPLIIKAFESYQKEFDAIEFYSVSSKRINLNELLKKNRGNQRLYLSTASGKYKVKKPIRRWNPISEFFQNHLTAVIRPIRSNFKGRAYGSNIRYLVELKFRDGNEQIIPIHATEYNWKAYRNFQITKEAIVSKHTLNVFFLDLIERNIVLASSVKIHDLEEYRNNKNDFYKNSPILNGQRYTWFQYYFFGRIYTFLDNRRMRIKNKQRNENT